MNIYADSLTSRTFGITVGTTVLQNGLVKKLPKDFLAQFPSGAEVSYSVIPIVRTLPEPLQTQVRTAFASSISNIWYTVMAMGLLGIIITLPMKQLELKLVTDANWGFETRPGAVAGPANPSRVDLEMQSEARQVE